jgi:hypothetical protein
MRSTANIVQSIDPTVVEIIGHVPRKLKSKLQQQARRQGIGDWRELIPPKHRRSVSIDVNPRALRAKSLSEHSVRSTAPLYLASSQSVVMASACVDTQTRVRCTDRGGDRPVNICPSSLVVKIRPHGKNDATALWEEALLTKLESLLDSLLAEDREGRWIIGDRPKLFLELMWLHRNDSNVPRMLRRLAPGGRVDACMGEVQERLRKYFQKLHSKTDPVPFTVSVVSGDNEEQTFSFYHFVRKGSHMVVDGVNPAIIPVWLKLRSRIVGRNKSAFGQKLYRWASSCSFDGSSAALRA